MIKILTTTDASVRDAIIQATNNQSAIVKHTLHATEKIQRDIEDILAQNGFYYERRPGYYKNQGKPKNQSITPVELASALIAMVFKNPYKAYRLKSKFMQSEKRYSEVFSDKLPLLMWPIITRTFLCARDYILTTRLGGDDSIKLMTSLVPVLCLCVLAKRFDNFRYSISDLLSLEKSFPSFADFKEILDSVPPNMLEGKNKINRSSYRRVAEPFVSKVASRFNIPYVANVGKWHPASEEVAARTIVRADQPSAELIEEVNRLLPRQPWPRGIDETVARALKVRRSLVSAAINVLISQGRWMIQRDGVIYDEAGNAIAVDASRSELSIDEINGILAGTIKSEIPVVEYNGIRVLQLIKR